MHLSISNFSLQNIKNRSFLKSVGKTVWYPDPNVLLKTVTKVWVWGKIITQETEYFQ